MTSPTRTVGKAVPYGVYDLSANTGWVTVGNDGDTAGVRRRHPAAAGGASVGTGRPIPTRQRLHDHRGQRWRQRQPAPHLEDRTCHSGRPRTGLAMSVCHLPPGTSKWNKIEHRLFSADHPQLAGQGP